MKKIWLLFILVLVIVSQVTVISSFHTAFASSYVSDTSAVVVSKMKYAYAKASIHILRSHSSSSPLTLTFPNGTQQEITDHSYSIDLFFPRTGDFVGTFSINTLLTTTPNSPTDSADSLPRLTLSSQNPLDLDVVQHIPNNFLAWHGNPNYDYDNKIDVFWFTIQGEANIFITGTGMSI